MRDKGDSTGRERGSQDKGDSGEEKIFVHRDITVCLGGCFWLLALVRSLGFIAIVTFETV